MSPESLPDISSFAAPVYIGFILLEIGLITWRGAKGAYETKDATTSLAMGTGNLTFGLIFAGSVYAAIYAGLLWLHQFALFDIGLSVFAVAACFVLDDLAYYWNHRFSHTVRWAWANHVIHHSSQHYNLTTALRQPWFGFATGLFVLKVPLVLLGFHPGIVAFCASLNLLYQFFIHTETVGKMPRWVEAVFNTPSHHRVHHGKNPRYLDSNYAGVFILWDRLFGTFVPEDEAEPVNYGLVKDIGTFNPLRVAVHEYVAIGQDASRPGLTLRQRLAYAFAPPGWSHDGSRKTSEEIRAEAGLPPRRKGRAPAMAPAE